MCTLHDHEKSRLSGFFAQKAAFEGVSLLAQWARTPVMTAELPTDLRRLEHCRLLCGRLTFHETNICHAQPR